MEVVIKIENSDCRLNSLEIMRIYKNIKCFDVKLIAWKSYKNKNHEKNDVSNKLKKSLVLQKLTWYKFIKLWFDKKT